MIELSKSSINANSIKILCIYIFMYSQTYKFHPKPAFFELIMMMVCYQINFFPAFYVLENFHKIHFVFADQFLFFNFFYFDVVKHGNFNFKIQIE